MYWYTFEVGLCKSHGQKKILGGALLTSLDESAISMMAESRPLTFEEMSQDPYLHGIQYSGLQPHYVESTAAFDTEFFPQLDAWLDSFLQKKDFVPRYCEASRSIEIL